MAASEILGLFTTPEQYQQNQLAQARSRAFQEVQLDPFQQAALGARTAGYQFGQAVGGALVNIVVTGNVISSVSLVDGGCYYVTNDVLSVSAADVGGLGSGFTVTVGTVTNSSGTTWLGDNFDSALFNATMLEALTYMKVLPEDKSLYEDRYTQSIALLKNLGDGKQRMDAYRDGQVRLQVN